MRRILVALLAVSLAGWAVAAATVNVMHGWPGEQAPAFQMIVDAFEAENPDIEVVVEIVGRDRPADHGLCGSAPHHRATLRTHSPCASNPWKS